MTFGKLLYLHAYKAAAYCKVGIHRIGTLSGRPSSRAQVDPPPLFSSYLVSRLCSPPYILLYLLIFDNKNSSKAATQDGNYLHVPITSLFFFESAFFTRSMQCDTKTRAGDRGARLVGMLSMWFGRCLLIWLVCGVVCWARRPSITSLPVLTSSLRVFLKFPFFSSSRLVPIGAFESQGASRYKMFEIGRHTNCSWVVSCFSRGILDLSITTCTSTHFQC